jgi:hypothetical protein
MLFSKSDHHPKWNEIIRADDCSISRQAKTSRLVVMKGGNSNGTSGPSETGSYPELKQLGSEYCDEHTCGLCEGMYFCKCFILVSERTHTNLSRYLSEQAIAIPMISAQKI